nr:retrovirus-related Pol polyprotein from transposon TNT 1-94 [Tanacetum cinerariifolium]
PECYFEAMKLKDSLQWELAMKDEMKSLEKNKTWLLTKLPSGKKALQNKWVFRKSLYGLKQAPRQWYLKFDNFMGRIGYKRCDNGHCCYIKKFKGSYIILLLYVDDMLIAVGSLMYAMVCTRPDIAHAVGVVSRFMSNPGREHWEAVKWLLRYLKGTSNMTLHFKGKDVILTGYPDADLGGCKDSYKSTTGYVFTVGGTAVSWMSKLQKSVALSTTEAEYMAIAEVTKELIWLKNFLKELGNEQVDCALFSDSQSAIHLAKNPVFHSKTKHIQLRYHFIREKINDDTLKLKKIKGTENTADMLTKVVTLEKLKFCIASTGLQPLPMAPAADSTTNVLAEWNAIYDPYNKVACLILDFAKFVRNYNMHNMGKMIGELHDMLIEYEEDLPKKAETPQVMMIKGGKIQKANKKSLKAKVKGKANGK